MWRNRVMQRRFRKKANKVMHRCKRDLVFFVETMTGKKLGSDIKDLINSSRVDYERLKFDMYGRR